MTYPLGRLVVAPDPAAQVLYDFNDRDADAERWIEAQGFTLGSPVLEGDPDAVGVTYGYRQPAFSHKIRGTKQDALLALSALSRQLLRQSTGWLMVQLDNATSPGWLRIHRSGVEALSLEQVYVDPKTGDPVAHGGVLQPDTWQIPLTLTADPFIYGERITRDAVTIVQAPDAEIPMHVGLDDIKGDAPTSLRVTVTPDVASGSAPLGSAWLLGCVAGSTDMTDTVVDIGTGDGFTAGTGTGAGSADSHYFSGTYRAVTIGASQPLATTRLSGTVPALALGRYKVLLRCEADRTGVDDQTYLFRIITQASATGPDFVGKTEPVTIDGHDALFSGWVDLGEINYPPGVASPDVVPDGQAAPMAGAGTFLLQITTADGSTGAVRLDAFKFIPISGPTVTKTTLLKTAFPDFYYPEYRTGPTESRTGTWDGDTESYWTTTVAPSADTGLVSSSPEMEGSYLVADPAAARNLLILMAIDNGSTNTGFGTSSAYIVSKGAEADVVVSYHPMFLNLPSGS